jgi:hypothetical protein
VTAGQQCDNCRKFGVSHAPGWLYLIALPPEMPSPLLAALGGVQSAEPLTFCCVRCVAEYAYVMAVAEAAGTEPQP